MTDERPFEARRMLVAIDASTASLDALSAAMKLAARLGATLEGIFVEDEDLLRLAALPFTDLVRTPGGALERFDSATAEASLRAVAARVRELVQRAAARHRIACTLRVVRGRVAQQIVAAAGGADLVVLGASSHGRMARSPMGATARAAAARAPSPVLLLPPGASLEGAAVALDDGTPLGSRALDAARRLAPEARPPAAVPAAGGGAGSVYDAIARLGPALAVLPATAPGAQAELAERLLAAGIAVLLLR